MAKSARASSKKSSRAKLRATLHGPQEDARLQRLSEKLLTIATTEKATVPTSTMEVDEGTKRLAPSHPQGVEKKKNRSKRLRHAASNKNSATDASKQTAEENPDQEQVKGLFTSTSQKPSKDVAALSHDFKLPVPASFLEESVGPTCRSSRPTSDEEIFYNALGLFPIANIQGFDEFKCLSLAVS